MTNKEIASTFNKLAGLMEIHNENPFKIRSYASAYITIRKWGEPIIDMSPDNIGKISGVGKSVQAKIKELIETGRIGALEEYKEKTPEGIQQMLGIKGFGPKKIKVVWKELGVESPGELLYACLENRLVELKGFGEKTQKDLIERLEYFLQSSGQQLFANLEPPANELMDILTTFFPDCRIQFTGPYRRRCVTLAEIDFLIESDYKDLSGLDEIEKGNEAGLYKYKGKYQFKLHFTSSDSYDADLFQTTGPESFVTEFNLSRMAKEEEIFSKNNLPFIVPELRDLESIVNNPVNEDELVTIGDIKGVVHNHSTWSDGVHSIAEMAQACIDKGYDYLVMSDHSKAAFYANGLKEDALFMQWEEIDRLNSSYQDFKIYKSIESDILNDGSLDYSDEILGQFDLVIASVHSNLRMDLEKANARLIKAIENPYTSILGHPTGRLLLSRKGYPIDHRKIIDACATNNTQIEINANPYRLDLDWTWIPYALEKGVYISINPDAHSILGIDDIKYGVFAARKGGLTKEMCLNARSGESFLKLLK